MNNDKELVVTEKEECLNSEKSKLQITPLGRQVCEFCYQHFESIFNYEFTNNMESGLDNIESRETCNCDLLRRYISNVEELIEETKTNYKKNPDQVKKVCDTSIYCGKIDGFVAYIKNGKYGYYLTHGKGGKIRVSLNDFKGFNIEDKIGSQEDITEDELPLLIDFLAKGKEAKNKSILVELNAEYSIMESKYGYYIYYKTKKMKQPKFMKYNDEKDDKTEMRNTWIPENNIRQIKKYLCEKYKINI